MTAQADAKLADYEKQLAAARTRANEEGRKVRAEAPRTRRTVTDKARAEAQKAIDEAHGEDAHRDRGRAPAAAAAGQRAREADREQAARPGGRMKRIALIAVLRRGVGARAVRAARAAPRSARRDRARRAELERRRRRIRPRTSTSSTTVRLHGQETSTAAVRRRRDDRRQAATSARTEKVEDEEEPMSPPFIFMLINFGILLIILAQVGRARRAQARRGAPRSDQDRARRGREAARRRPRRSSPSTRRGSRTSTRDQEAGRRHPRRRRGRQGAHPRGREGAVRADEARRRAADRRRDRARARAADPRGHRRRGGRDREAAAREDHRPTIRRKLVAFLHLWHGRGT